MDPITKSYVSLGLVFLALFEFWAAMRIFGKKGSPSKHARLILRLHRIGGYIFLVYFMWISWICAGLVTKYAQVGKELDSRAVLHAWFAMSLLGALLLKICFIRFYRNYRPYVPALGVVVSTGTLVLWGLAGWMFLLILG